MGKNILIAILVAICIVLAANNKQNKDQAEHLQAEYNELYSYAEPFRDCYNADEKEGAEYWSTQLGEYFAEQEAVQINN